MTNLKKNFPLPLAVLVLGAAAYCLRRALYAAALDEKGLLTPNHPLETALWAVVLAGAALTVLSVRKSDGSNTYEDNFCPALYGSLGHCLMGGTVLVMALNTSFSLPGPIGLVWRVLGFLSAPALVWGGICRKTGRKPFFGIHAAVCLFLLLYLISRYQIWSGNPQLQDYVFQLLALVSLTLFCYQQAAFDADMGNRKWLLATGLLAVLLCCAAVYGSEASGLYLCGAVWAVTNLCVLTPPKKDEVDAHDPA